MIQNIRSFLDHLAKERNFSPHTLRNYGVDLHQFITFLEKAQIRSFSEIDQLVLREFLSSLKEGKGEKRGCAPCTVARKLSSIRTLFKFLIRKGVINSDPSTLVRAPRRSRRLPPFLTEEEVETLLNTPDNEGFIGLRDRAILEVFYSTGMRVSEVVGSDLPDMNLSNGFIRVRGKGRKERLCMLGPPAVAAVRAYLPTRKKLIMKRTTSSGQALFLNQRTAYRITDRSIGRILKGYLVRAGLSSRHSPHSLRHSFATHIMNRGANLREIQELLGHKRITSTQIYTHLNINRLQEVYEKAHPRSTITHS